MIITKERYKELLDWVINNPNHEIVKKYGNLSPKIITRQLIIMSVIRDIDKYEVS